MLLMDKLGKSEEKVIPINVADIPRAMKVNNAFFGCLNVFRKKALSPRNPWNALLKISVVAIMVRKSAV